MIRNPWKAVLVLLAISPVTMACRGFAQQRDGASDGLHAVPDTGQHASADQKSASDGSAQTFMNSLDPQGERFKRDSAKAEAAANADASAKTMQELADSGGAANWASWPKSLSETAWIAILAGVGLSLSLAATAYVWRVRTQQANVGSPIVLTVNQEPISSPDSIEKQDRDKTVTRRAA